MDVILIRHAVAIDETLALHDPARYLTAAGRDQARRLGERLRARLVAPTHVWTSPLVRAVQTAELVAQALAVTCAVEAVPGLSPDESPRTAARALAALPATAVVLVVGHEPGLSALGALLVRQPDFAALGKAEAACIASGAPSWRATWES